MEQHQQHVQTAAASHSVSPPAVSCPLSRQQNHDHHGGPDEGGASSCARGLGREDQSPHHKGRTSAPHCRADWRGHGQECEGTSQDFVSVSGAHQGAEQGIRQKKADLITFCQDTLGLKDKEVSNKTIPQLQMVAMKHIMSHTPPHEMDLVNFGKYSDARYHEVLEKYPEYARWVKQTYQEGGNNCEARLQRLALWLEAQEKVELKPDETSKRGSIHSYVTSHKTMTDNSGASSSAASSSMETAVFQEMIGAIRELQKEVRGLKQEPARKKVMKSEESEVETDGSFMPVNRSP